VAGFYRFAIARDMDHSPLPAPTAEASCRVIPSICSEQDVRAPLNAVDGRNEEDWLVRLSNPVRATALSYNHASFGPYPRHTPRPV
jgi:hypothetical protein